ncbi:MAG: hypothetical protein AABX38_00020 [Candidatus Micrarchaeota archaeon]
MRIYAILILFLLIFGCTTNSTVQKENQTNDSLSDIRDSIKQGIKEGIIEGVKTSTAALNASANNSTQIKIEVSIIAPTQACVDFDGDDIFNSSNVTTYGQVYEDVCTGPRNVREYTCSKKGDVSYYVTECPRQYTCIEGGCVKIAQTCKDSDDGINENVSASVWINDANGFLKEYKDTCLSSNQLLEYYCNGSEQATRIIDCNSQFSCDKNSPSCTFPR